jgi:3-oxoadipate enol-lactonase
VTHINVNDANLFVSDTGGDQPGILFIHGLMLASESWEAQVAQFRRTHRVVTYDLRGQGHSEKTLDRLDLDSLTEDAASLIEKLRIGRVHIVAFSMGSFIAIRLAARRPDLIRSLTMIGPSADAEDPSKLRLYNALIKFVRVFGARAFAGPMTKILFGKSFLADPTVKAERDRWRKVVRDLPRNLHRAATASAHRNAIWNLLPAINAPTLIVSGEEDRPIPTNQARKVHQEIIGSLFISVPGTGHAVMIEKTAAFNTMLANFLNEVEAQSGPRQESSAKVDE